jgi:hypothetical protein
MFLGAPGLKRATLAILVLTASTAILLSCGSNYNPTVVGSNTVANPATIRVPVFVSNPLSPNGTSNQAVVNVVNGETDLISPNAIPLGSSAPMPGMMVLFPNKLFTAVFSSSNNAVVVINNATQTLSQSSSGATISVTLPDSTESIVVGPDNASGFAALPNSPIPGQLPGQPPGLVEALDLANGAVSAGIPVPGARFVALSHNGNRLLALGNRADTITVIAPTSLGTATDPRTDVQSPLFDHPVWATFSNDDSTAYILNCGPECGGTTAGVTLLDVNSNVPGPTIPLDAATVGLLSGNTLYVAGTKPGANTCAGSSTPTLATTCGEVSVVDLVSMTVKATAIITDGNHNHIELASNNQLFIGARTCTNINVAGNSGSEVRGCLSIFDTGKLTVVVPPAVGDVTGIQPISRRNAVYVVQNGVLDIYDSTTDQLQKTQVDITGQPVDVKQVN